MGCLDAANGKGAPFGVEWWNLTNGQATAVMAAAIEHFSPRSANNVRSAIRRVLHECWLEGLMSAEDRKRAREIQGAKVNNGEVTGRILTDDEIDLLLRVCENDRSPAGRRDAAIVAVLTCGGLRRSEAVALNLEDYKPSADIAELIVRKGKGGKSRNVYLSASAIFYVGEWLEVRGHQAGALFWKIGKSGVMKPDRFSDDALAKLLDVRTAQARGILQTLNPNAEFPDWTPHDARRTFCTNLIESSKDINSACDLMGYASPATTKRYDRRGERAKRQAAATLSIPIRRGNQHSRE
jgi:site-specific recombinase XerD